MQLGSLLWPGIIVSIVMIYILFKRGVKPTLSNIFYGLGVFTGIMSILYFIARIDASKEAKILVLFIMAIIVMALGYIIAKKKGH